MPYQATDLFQSYDYPPDTVTRADGGFGKDDKEVIGRWVEKDESTGSLRLVAANRRPLGVIEGLSPTQVGVALGPIVNGNQSRTAALQQNVGVTGATKVVVSGGDAERGFVTEETGTAIANAERLSLIHI